MSFGPTFIQPPQRIPYKDRIPQPVDDFGDFTSGEVRRMNQEFIEDEKLRKAGHND